MSSPVKCGGFLRSKAALTTAAFLTFALPPFVAEAVRKSGCQRPL